jgi:hypothetical protein
MTGPWLRGAANEPVSPRPKTRRFVTIMTVPVVGWMGHHGSRVVECVIS